MKRGVIKSRRSVVTSPRRGVSITKITRPSGRGKIARPSTAASIRTRNAQEITAWRTWGVLSGEKEAQLHSVRHEGYQKKALNEHWLRRLADFDIEKQGWESYHAAAQGYLNGYCRGSGVGLHDWVLMPSARSVAAIITVMNEESTILDVILQLHRLPLDEIIIVVNGSNDQTFNIVKEASQAIIVHYHHPLGHDVGRSIGAKLAKSDILLFLDGDFPIPAEQLLPFIYAIDQGMDIALNDISPYLNLFSRWDSVTILKQLLNVTLLRPELKANSLTAVPHAISKQACERIGYMNLMVPPKAQAWALLHHLKIGLPTSINIISANKRKSQNVGSGNPVAEMITGDHLEALHMAMDTIGERIFFLDEIRKREYANGGIVCK
jgi:hypothetical protein